MTEREDIEMVVAVLKKVPEKKLLLIDIANRVAVKDGELDQAALAEIQPEVERAISEAKEYAGFTSRAVGALLTMGQRDREED
ncbi:MAG: hypothetical protein Q8R28_04255 [Dehalococcoidia bacterium]|nr:hypothetical protein [Dehalococcoidia bacterium]